MHILLYWLLVKGSLLLGLPVFSGLYIGPIGIPLGAMLGSTRKIGILMKAMSGSIRNR